MSTLPGAGPTLARFELSERPTLTVLRILGDVDVSNAPELSAVMDRAGSGPSSVVALDLSDTTYLDSAGIRLVFVLAERLQARRMRFRVIVPETSPVRAVLEVTGLPSVVPLEPSLEEA